VVATVGETGADIKKMTFIPLDQQEVVREGGRTGLELGDERERTPTACRLAHLEAFVAERRSDGVDDRGFVVDDEDAACGGAVHVSTVPRKAGNRLRKRSGRSVSHTQDRLSALSQVARPHRVSLTRGG